jgi:hypothetical protein
MNPVELAKAYQGFFFKNEAGQQFMQLLESMERRNISDAQDQQNLFPLGKSAGQREIIEHISTVISQSE